MNIWEEIKESFKEGSALTRLIYINLGLFLMIKITYTVFYLSGNGIIFQNWVLSWLALPADFELLASRPWINSTVIAIPGILLIGIINLAILRFRK